MIPKVINYIWFGGNKKSQLILDCMKSWKKFCPDYKIVEWNEKNYDMELLPKYAKDAYKNKKWAFVSDVVRHDIMYKHGGIYLDVDVELIKPLDEFVENEFLALENKDSINTGLIMCMEKGNKYCKNMLDLYANEVFELDSGVLNLKTVCVRTVEYFDNKGFKHEDIFQMIDGINIYPSEYFCPYNDFKQKMSITKNTIGIHRYLASWRDKKNNYKLAIARLVVKMFGRKTYEKLVIIKDKIKGK